MQKALEGHNLHCVHQNKADFVQHITVITCSEGLQRSLDPITDPIDYNDSIETVCYMFIPALPIRTRITMHSSNNKYSCSGELGNH